MQSPDINPMMQSKRFGNTSKPKTSVLLRSNPTDYLHGLCIAGPIGSFSGDKRRKLQRDSERVRRSQWTAKKEKYRKWVFAQAIAKEISTKTVVPEQDQRSSPEPLTRQEHSKTDTRSGLESIDYRLVLLCQLSWTTLQAKWDDCRRNTSKVQSLMCPPPLGARRRTVQRLALPGKNVWFEESVAPSVPTTRVNEPATVVSLAVRTSGPSYPCHVTKGNSISGSEHSPARHWLCSLRSPCKENLVARVLQ